MKEMKKCTRVMTKRSTSFLIQLNFLIILYERMKGRLRRHSFFFFLIRREGNKRIRNRDQIVSDITFTFVSPIKLKI